MENNDLYRAIAADTTPDSGKESVPGCEDASTQMSSLMVDVQRKKIEKLDEELQDLRQDRGQRRVFSYVLFGFMSVYVLLILAVVVCCGVGCMRLSDTVLVTLLSTTVADVVGVFSFVAKYLYRSK